MSTTPPEHIITMMVEFRDEVLAGKRTTAWRPGHRSYTPGPATIKFMVQGGSGPYFTEDQPLGVVLTRVEHAIAEGKYEIFMNFMRTAGQPAPDLNQITLLEWRLP